MKIKKNVLDRSLTFENFLQEQLQDNEFQKEYLRFNITEYSKNGDYAYFFKSLEQVVKSRTSVSKFAESINLNRSNLSNILKGKVQPSFDTTMKILRGLGAEFEIKIA